MKVKERRRAQNLTFSHHPGIHASPACNGVLRNPHLCFSLLKEVYFAHCIAVVLFHLAKIAVSQCAVFAQARTAAQFQA